MADFERYYYCNACHVCKSENRELRACSACRAYRYCSVDHQRLHWPVHKRLCRYIRRKPFKCKSKLEYQLARTNFKNVIEQALNRPLVASEAQLWMFPRVCAVCKSNDSTLLFDCLNCPSTSYCSKLCQDTDNHDLTCLKMQIQSRYYLQMLHESPNQYVDINLNIPFNQLQREIFEKDDNETSNSSVFTSEKLSHVFTLFHSLNIAEIEQDTLVIHVVGATYEYIQFDRQVCELLSHWNPNLKSITVVLVGPELCPFKLEDDNWKFCNNCTHKGLKVHHRFEVALYSNYRLSLTFVKPNIVAVFNCGFHEFHNTECDSWIESIPHLLIQNVPLLITSYTSDESVQDFNILNNCFKEDDKIEVFACCKENKFKSLLPLRDWVDDKFYYKNYFYSVIKKIE